MRRTFAVSMLCASMCAAALAAPPPQEQANGPHGSAAVDRAVKAYIAGLDKQLAENREVANPKQVEMTDLDGDGKEEAVLLYETLGPTFWDAGLTVFADRGKGYVVVAESHDPLGNMVESIEVGDGLIRVHALWEGPDDPRCCPSIKRTTAYRLKGTSLVKTSTRGR